MGSRKSTQREIREGAKVSDAPSEATPYRELSLARERLHKRFRELSGFDLDDLGKMDRCARTMGPG